MKVADLTGLALDYWVARSLHDFVREVIGARGVGVHARAAAHGLEAAQDLDVGSVIGLTHPFFRFGDLLKDGDPRRCQTPRARNLTECLRKDANSCPHYGGKLATNN